MKTWRKEKIKIECYLIEEGKRIFNNRIEAERDKLKARSFLLNFYKYFLEFAVILCYHDHYRLLVIHKGELVVDNTYRTHKAARVAFSRFFKDRAWKRYDQPEWSEFYEFEKKRGRGYYD